MMTDRIKRFFFRFGQLAGLVAMAGLGAADLQNRLVPTGEGSVRELLGLLEVPTAMAVAAVWLPEHKQGTRLLPALAVAVSALSLLLTIAEANVTGHWGGSWGAAETGGLLGLLTVVARRSDARLAWPAGIAVAAAITLGPFAMGIGNETVIIALVMALLAGAAAVAGSFVRFQDITRVRQLETVRAEQRTEFARDLHDFIAHHVTGIVVQAQGARIIAEQDPQRAVRALEQIEKAGAETMASMRRMVGVLRQTPESSPNGSEPAPLAPLAGVDELQPLVDSFTANGGAVGQLHIDGDMRDLPVEITSSAYRVVMEALTNIRQHAQDATAVDVWVRRTPDWLLVRVANDGPPPRSGITREARGRFGLIGLNERLAAVGGRLQAGPGIDGGWVVDAGLPLRR
jgi:signal transduction histidine kinase